MDMIVCMCVCVCVSLTLYAVEKQAVLMSMTGKVAVPLGTFSLFLSSTIVKKSQFSVPPPPHTHTHTLSPSLPSWELEKSRSHNTT